MNERYLNRELSWLEFNQRVLDEAFDEQTPLLERLKFLAISASNLDEFFRVRFGSLQILAKVAPGSRDISGMTPIEQIEAISARVSKMVADQHRCFLDELEPRLAANGVERRTAKSLGEVQLQMLQETFADEATSILAPIGVSRDKPWPHLANLSFNLCVRLVVKEGSDAAGEQQTASSGDTRDTNQVTAANMEESTESTELERFAILPIGDALPRIVRLHTDGAFRYVLVEDAIKCIAELFFPGDTILECVPFRITRNADLSIREDNAADLLQGMTEVLDARKESPCIRLELGTDASQTVRQLLAEQYQLEASQIFACPGPIDLAAYFRLAGAQGLDHLRFERWRPQPSPKIDPAEPICDTIERGDVMLVHPYESFDPVVRFLKEAADDPDVLAIKQTLYRTSRNSPIISSLARAAENGKNVTVLVELKARFDEARNIEGARALEQAGAHVVYGVKGFKTHAKLCVVTKRGPNGLQRFLHFGTGNYNEATAELYSDVSLLTADEDLGRDATNFFNAICGFSQPQPMKKLQAAPLELRDRLLELIEIEIQQVEAGNAGLIRAKVNSLVDKALIDALYSASQAGVQIELNVRGICCLRPGIAGLSENIRVTSIVDRLLEHARIVHFHHGGDPVVLISSADWMERNLDRRLELLVPIQDPEYQRRLLHTLDCYARDNIKASELNSDGTYTRVHTSHESIPFRSQQTLYTEACEDIRRLERQKLTKFEPHGGIGSRDL